jgi:integrase
MQRFHDARHTHASLSIGWGADIVAVSRRLGHANSAITTLTVMQLAAETPRIWVSGSQRSW